MGNSLLKNFDGNTGKLNVLGTQLQLGENDDHKSERSIFSEDDEEDHDDDDD